MPIFMEINLKIVGDNLFNLLSKDQEALNDALWKITQRSERVVVNFFHASELHADDLLINVEFPSMLIIEARDSAQIEKIQDFGKLKNAPLISAQFVPIIAAFHSDASLGGMIDLPDLISDWLFIPVAVPELARRILGVLREKKLLRTKLQFGFLTLLPNLRTVSYFGKTMHLTESEFALAELFFSQSGIVPTSDLTHLFKSNGKSAENNNIRVTIFQLRLKLEMLTKSQFTLASVYKQGYCLKQKVKHTSSSAFSSNMSERTTNVRALPTQL